MRVDEDANMLSEKETASRRSRIKRGVVGGLVLAAATGGLVVAVGPTLGGSTSGVVTDQARANIEADLEQQLLQTSPEQQRVVADGSIETAELEALAKQADACAVEQGSPRTELTWTKDGFSRGLDFGDVKSREERDRLLRIADDCWNYHVGVAEQMRAVQMLPPVEEQIDFNVRVTECLNDAGASIEGWPGTQEEVDPSLEADCVDKSQAG